MFDIELFLFYLGHLRKEDFKLFIYSTPLFIYTFPIPHKCDCPAKVTERDEV